MEALKNLKALTREIHLLEKQSKQMRTQERKEDTRRKIQLGGLIIKAGLDYLHPKNTNILLGLLVDARQKLRGEQKIDYEMRYSELGNKQFKDKND